MKKRVPYPVLLIGIALILPLAVQGGAEPAQEKVAKGWPSMPDLVWFKPDYTFPLFVAAERVLDANGSVDSELFPEAIAEQITELLAKDQKGSCIEDDSVSSIDLPGSIASFADAVSESDNVILTEVVGLRFGFRDARAGSLLRITTIEVLRGVPKRNDHYVFFAEGNFRVGKKNLCKTNRNFAKRPNVGDELLVMYDDHWFNDGSELLSTGPTGLVPLKLGQVELPQHYWKTDPDLSGASRHSLSDYVREIVSAGEFICQKQ